MTDKDAMKVAQPAQEPVAWQWLGSAHFRKKLPKNADITAWNPLYTTPPVQRTEQEPVAYVSTAELSVFSTVKEKAMVELWKLRVFDSDVALYTTPPAAQRPWLDLTDEQIKAIDEMALTKNMAIVMTMATLKEKNT